MPTIPRAASGKRGFDHLGCWFEFCQARQLIGYIMNAMLNHEIAMELERLENPTGRVSPDVVVIAAKSLSALRPRFEWDDVIAASERRRNQAEELIMRLLAPATVVPFMTSSPAYVKDSGINAATIKQYYLRLNSISFGSELAQRTVVAEVSAAIAAVRRAQRVADALNMGENATELFASMGRLSVSRK